MRVVFFGTSVFAIPALRAMAEHVVLVVSQPPRPTGRGMKTQETPVAAVAHELGLPLETPEKCRAIEFVERIRALEADFLLVAAYGQILPQSLLDSAKRGAINLHGSILPAYRGAAPIQRAILDGCATTGVTLMQMDKGMDTGAMIATVETAIGADETYGELQDRLAEIAAQLVFDWAPRIATGDYNATPQDDAHATYAPKMDRAEGRLDLGSPAIEAYRRFRAVTPNPGAFIETSRGRIKVAAARICDDCAEPGTWIAPDRVAMNGGALELREVQPEGKRRMSGRDLANGLRLSDGDSLLP